MSLDARPGVVLIGAGMYGGKYLQEMTEKDSGGDLRAVVDVAENLQERYPALREKGIPVYREVKDFLREGWAELAVISSPIHLHTGLVLECLQAGMNVLCEKPLCLTEKETRLLAAAAEKAGRFLAVGWQLNYDRAVQALKQDILSGRFGAPLRFRCVHAMRRGMNYYGRSAWAGRISLEGREVFDSPFMNACAHNFQLMTFLLGLDLSSAAEIAEGEGRLFRGNPTVENYDIAFLRFRTDQGVPLYYYTAHPLRTKNLGQKGRGEFEHGVITWGRGEPFRAVLETGEEIIYGPEGETPPMQKLYDAIRCTKNGDQPLCGPLTGLGHLQAARLAQRFPVENVPESRIRWLEEEGDRFPCVSGLEEALTGWAEKWELPRGKDLF